VALYLPIIAIFISFPEKNQNKKKEKEKKKEVNVMLRKK